MSQLPKKRKKTVQKNSRVATKASQARPVLTDVAPLEPPRLPFYVHDTARDAVGLLEAPFDGSTSYDIWMNAKPLLPSSSIALDEKVARLVSNLVPAPYPRDDGWSREARRQNQQGSDAEYSLGGHWSDDEGSYDDADSIDEEVDFESEESFGGPWTPSRQPIDGPRNAPVANETRTTSKGAPALLSPQVNGSAMLPSSLRSPRVLLSPSDLINDTPIVPSQKALGKRRADIPPSPVSRGPHALSPNRMRVGSNTIAYRQVPSPGHSSIHTDLLPRTIYRGNQASDVLLSNLSTMKSPQMSFAYEPRLSPMRQDNEATEDDSLFFGNTAPTVPESSSRTTDSLWHPTGDTGLLGEQQYSLDTINPALLQQAQEYMQEDALSMPAKEDDWGLAYPVGEQVSSSLSGSSRASSRPPTPSTSQQKKTASTSKTVVEFHQPTIRRERTSPPPSETYDLPELPPYKSDSDDADWEGSDAGRAKLGRGKRKKTKRKRADFDWHDGSDGTDDILDAAVRFSVEEKSRAATTKKVGPPKNAVKLAIGPPRGAGQWETGAVQEYCHQCRNKTYLLKMVCLACALKYCNRCIGVR